MLGPGTILLVEDAESDALLICEAFRRARIMNPIARVSCGNEALSYLNGTGRFADRAHHPRPDFVLLDVLLPDGTGLDILRSIRCDPALAGLPVIVVTGMDLPSLETDARNCGASAFFRKALRFEDLVQIVRTIGGQWGLGVEPDHPSPRQL